MTRSWRVRLWVLSVAAMIASTCNGALADDRSITPDTLTDQHVVAAINAIVQELYERLHPESLWEPRAGYSGSQIQVGGYTALVALAMLYAGESYQDPRLRRAIEHLESAHFRGTYAVAVRTSLWANLPPRFAPHLRNDAQWLLDGFSQQVGSWTYDQSSTTLRRDNSIRQYGALALWDATKRGVHVPSAYWQAIEQNLLDMQLADGGWNYNGSGPSTGSMTAAGLTSLFIIQDLLHAERSVSLSTRQSRSELAIENAMQWMHQNFSASENPGYQPATDGTDHFYYYLYGVERVGLAGGYKYFGSKDWYLQGAAELLARLCSFDADGAVRIHNEEFGDGREISNSDLAFALMFLSRGRMPSIINKLQDDSFAWNNRPRDVPNLAIWIAGETARHVIWQITDINAPGEQWLDAPMHYLASQQAVNWTDEPDDVRLKNLKAYLDRGGLLLAVDEGNARAFAESIERAGSMMYPDYQWRTLPQDHWAYRIRQPVSTNPPRLRGLSNGVRELIILSPSGDFSATFQSRNRQNRSHYHTVGNIYFYASEMDRPRSRLATLSSRRQLPLSDDPIPHHDALRIVRAEYDGNWNPEPAAWPQFAQWLASENIRLMLDTSPLDQVHQLKPAPAMVIVAGVDAHQFTIDERTAMRQYMRDGGLLLFETAGGMGSFASDAESLIEQMTKQSAQSMLRHRIITGHDMQRAQDLSRLDYRPYTLDVLGSLDTTPRLRGLVVDGRVGALFSRDDLSHALLDQPCWGVMGYSTGSARRLLSNIVLHILDQSK